MSADGPTKALNLILMVRNRAPMWLTGLQSQAVPSVAEVCGRCGSSTARPRGLRDVAHAPGSKSSEGLHVSEQHACSAVVSSQICDPKHHQQMSHKARNMAHGQEGRQGEAPPPTGRAYRLCRGCADGQARGEHGQVVRPLHTQCKLLTARLLRGLQEGIRPAPVHPRAPTRTLPAGVSGEHSQKSPSWAVPSGLCPRPAPPG